MTSPDAQFPTPNRRTANSHDRVAPSISGRQLTRLLARWADARRVNPGQVETIRLAARAAPAGLGFDWWWRLLDPDTGSVFRAAPLRPGPGDAGWLSVEAAFAPEGPGFMTWPQDDVEYQPYLRLA